MKKADYLQGKTAEIVEDAISQLMALGMKHDGAAYLLVIQGAIRIKDQERFKEALEFIAAERRPTD